jgi:hypothetical protein
VKNIVQNQQNVSFLNIPYKVTVKMEAMSVITPMDFFFSSQGLFTTGGLPPISSSW